MTQGETYSFPNDTIDTTSNANRDDSKLVFVVLELNTMDLGSGDVPIGILTNLGSFPNIILLFGQQGRYYINMIDVLLRVILLVANSCSKAYWTALCLRPVPMSHQETKLLQLS